MESFYDRALSEVGHDGSFQLKFDLLYNILFSGLWVMAYNNMILALTIIPHTCKVPKKPENISENMWKFKYIPTVEDATGKKKSSDCLIYTSEENNKTKGCDLYEYDNTWFETTIPSENNWVCENEIHVANVFAYSRISEITGSLFFGWFGDVYGRKPSYIISLAMLIIGRFTSVLGSSSSVIFVVGCVIASFPSWTAVQSASVISIEISSAKRRASITKSRLVAFSLGLSLMPLIYWWFRNWKPFLLITIATQLPFLLFSGKMIESPQWLWITKQPKKCVQTLRRLEKANNTKLNPETEAEILINEPDITTKTEVVSPLAVFAGRRMATNTILQLLLWISVSVNYNVALISSAEKSAGNPFLGFAWQSLAEIPGYFVAAWLADRIGRRYTGVLSSALITVIWIVLAFVEMSNIVFLKNDILISVLWITIRITITVTYYAISLFNMELYPTCLRQLGMSLGNVVSGIAGMSAPYILHLGRRIDARYPSIILIVTTVIGGILSSYFLPETLNAKLPETIEEAQRFGQRERRTDVKEKDESVELNTLTDQL
ncbi:unnamed protein product [Chrysodeixis includens]|uniref:Major facilitator superfamily (MFS) profile domain-containing protein n=1 Tax=Chrysodeixis includens TaxID=689277 RepID=A0A9P0C140_CHRIL|nr:unnamed protein product [Chrysodeixis includens]